MVRWAPQAPTFPFCPSAERFRALGALLPDRRESLVTDDREIALGGADETLRRLGCGLDGLTLQQIDRCGDMGAEFQLANHQSAHRLLDENIDPIAALRLQRLEVLLRVQMGLRLLERMGTDERHVAAAFYRAEMLVDDAVAPDGRGRRRSRTNVEDLVRDEVRARADHLAVDFLLVRRLRGRIVLIAPDGDIRPPLEALVQQSRRNENRPEVLALEAGTTGPHVDDQARGLDEGFHRTSLQLPPCWAVGWIQPII